MDGQAMDVSLYFNVDVLTFRQWFIIFRPHNRLVGDAFCTLTCRRTSPSSVTTNGFRDSSCIEVFGWWFAALYLNVESSGCLSCLTPGYTLIGAVITWVGIKDCQRV